MDDSAKIVPQLALQFPLLFQDHVISTIPHSQLDNYPIGYYDKLDVQLFQCMASRICKEEERH